MADEISAPAAVPVELEHAHRHLEAAELEWAAGKMPLAAMHLREAIADAAWSLYYVGADEISTRNARSPVTGPTSDP